MLSYRSLLTFVFTASLGLSTVLPGLLSNAMADVNNGEVIIVDGCRAGHIQVGNTCVSRYSGGSGRTGSDEPTNDWQSGGPSGSGGTRPMSCTEQVVNKYDFCKSMVPINAAHACKGVTGGWSAIWSCLKREAEEFQQDCLHEMEVNLLNCLD